jgi:hypothetical protein
MNLEKRADVLLKSLASFYSSQNNMKTLINVLQKKTKISLRVLDYLCTNYAKTNDIMVTKKGSRTSVNLYSQYRAHLKGYSKQQFDPFKRHERINIPCQFLPSKVLETTVAQLNFFKFVIEHNIFEYLNNTNALVIIENEMSKSTKIKKIQQTKKDITQVLVTCAKRHNMDIVVTFK